MNIEINTVGEMDKKIIEFLKNQSCATLCCTDEAGKPHCFSCFYAFDYNNGTIYFKSSANSQHAVLMKRKPFIAGTVLPDKLNKLAVKGIQFEAGILDSTAHDVREGAQNYFLKHPVALLMPGELWALQINHIKMTDNTLGFGHKIIWNRYEVLQEAVELTKTK